ncbi:Lysine decarboxylase, inducible [Raoultella terrigena]|uniref:Lysine decarboxylase, inducible n=1 Tax=Raoultella terrigena TaxID=577 RepID=A0A4U9DE89_RAOTE|nr:Lysine decarboxylase, inducible [Raoultella terrigena]
MVEKTGPYNLLFLFSIGIDKTKALSLLRALTDFKRAFDLNLRVKNMLPSLYREDPEFYETCAFRSWHRTFTNWSSITTCRT